MAGPKNVLPEALERFSGLTAGLPISESEPDRPATIASVRNSLEHRQNLAIRGRLGLASGTDGWWISYSDRMFQTKELLTAAEDLHHAVRAAVDPEAFSDFHGDHPFIELRDPADITRPWRPGSDITGRQAATMARIQALGGTFEGWLGDAGYGLTCGPAAARMAARGLAWSCNSGHWLPVRLPRISLSEPTTSDRTSRRRRDFPQLRLAMRVMPSGVDYAPSGLPPDRIRPADSTDREHD